MEHIYALVTHSPSGASSPLVRLLSQQKDVVIAAYKAEVDGFPGEQEREDTYSLDLGDYLVWVAMLPLGVDLTDAFEVELLPYALPRKAASQQME